MGVISKTIDLDLLNVGETKIELLPYETASNGWKNVSFEATWINMTASYAGSTIGIVDGFSTEALSVGSDITAGALNYTTGTSEVATDTQAKASGFGNLQITVTKGTGVTTNLGSVTIAVSYDGDIDATKSII